MSAETSSNQAENTAELIKKALKLIEEGSVSAQRSTIGMGDLQKKVQGVSLNRFCNCPSRPDKLA